MKIENAAFNGNGFGESQMRTFFENKDNLCLLIENADKKILGYTQISINGDTAYIYNTAVDPEHQGKGHVGKLMSEVEIELKNRGVKWLTRNAAVSNGYAGSIQRYYGDRIVETSENGSPWGPQRYFKIKL